MKYNTLMYQKQQQKKLKAKKIASINELQLN